MHRAMIRQRLTMLLGCLALASCGDEASVGRDSCYQNVTCEEVRGGSLLTRTETSSALFEHLQATWTRTTLGSTPITAEGIVGLVDGKYPGLGGLGGLGGGGALSGIDGLGGLANGVGTTAGPLLATGAQKTPWMFVASGAGVTVLFVDSAGELLAEQALAPPQGYGGSDAAGRSYFTSAQSHASGPALSVWWSPGPCSPEDGECGLSEVMLFAADPNQAPQRIPMPGEQGVRVAFRSSLGERVIVATVNQRVFAMDTGGKVTWERALPDLNNDYVFFRFAYSSSDELMISLIPIRDHSSYASGWLYSNPFSVLSVTESATRLLTFYSQPGISLLGSALVPMLSPAGTPRMIQTSDRGDLVVYDMADDPPVSAAILVREDYADLSAYAGALDERGTLYLSTRAGGRQLEDRVALLCRVPRNLSAFTCFEVDDLPYQLVTGEPDVVYAYSAAGLSRYDFAPLLSRD